MTIEQAREAAAAAYPEFLVDTLGREHPCIARKAILEGKWDAGTVVTDHLAAKEREVEG